MRGQGRHHLAGVGIRQCALRVGGPSARSFRSSAESSAPTAFGGEVDPQFPSQKCRHRTAAGSCTLDPPTSRTDPPAPGDPAPPRESVVAADVAANVAGVAPVHPGGAIWSTNGPHEAVMSRRMRLRMKTRHLQVSHTRNPGTTLITPGTPLVSVPPFRDIPRRRSRRSPCRRGYRTRSAATATFPVVVRDPHGHLGRGL